MARASFLNLPTGDEAPYLLSTDGKVLKSLPHALAAYAEAVTSRYFAAIGSPANSILRVADRGGVVRSWRLDVGRLGSSIAWSPDGRFLLTAESGVPDPVSPMRVFEVRGGQPGLVRTLSFASDPVWSPDGRWVMAHFSFDALMVERPDGSSRHQLAGRISDFSWATDSRRVLFARPTTLKQGSNSDLVVSGVEGDRSDVLVRNLAFSGFSWQPHGEQIAFVSNGQLWLTSSGGGRLRRLAPSLQVYGDPVWSPDGARLAVTANGDVWVVDARPGVRPRRLTQGWRYGYSSRVRQWLPTQMDALPGQVVSPAVPTDTVIAADELRTSAPIAQIAADGERLVVAFKDNWYVNRPEPYRGTGRNCLELWNHATGADRVVVLGGPCTVNPMRARGLGARGMQSLVVAGDRVAFARFDHFGGTDRHWVSTLTDSISAIKTVRGIECDAADQFDCAFDPKLDLEGDGDLLVFDSWRCVQPYGPACEFLPKQNGRLWRLVGTTARQIASGNGPMTPLSVDRGRILVDRGTDGYAVLDGQGRTIARYQLNRAVVKDARLQGDDLVVLTPLGVEVSNAATGEYLARWPSPATDAPLVDLQDGIAVLEAAAGAFLMRVSDGKTVSLEVDGRQAQHAQIEPEGLFASYAVDDPEQRGRVRFEPMARTRDRFAA